MKRILIIAFSAGWLVPAWLSLNAYLTFIDSEAWPRLRGEEPLNSFPFVQFSHEMMTISVIWLGLAIAYWAWKATAETAGGNA